MKYLRFFSIFLNRYDLALIVRRLSNKAPKQNGIDPFLFSIQYFVTITQLVDNQNQILLQNCMTNAITSKLA